MINLSRKLPLGPAPIDLGGIGKGLAVRWAMTALEGCGSSVMVEAGGDLATRGAGPEGTGWRAAVEDPLVPAGAPQRHPVAVLDVSDRAVATSSIRLRTWRVGGRRFTTSSTPAPPARRQRGWPRSR